MTLVEETGTFFRDIRDLEEQIDVERGKNIEESLARITADLEEMEKGTEWLKCVLCLKSRPVKNAFTLLLL